MNTAVTTAANPNQALWEKGDFTKIAEFMRYSGHALVHSLGLQAPLRALDLGCGDGTTAVPLARLGIDVTGVDIARNLVAAGNKRAAEEGLGQLQFREGDACNLHGLHDHAFDLTLSIFGAMFCPKPFEVAREMIRVTKPGGRIVMGNWIPNDVTSFVSQLLAISSSYTPPPPEGFISPMTWGVESHIVERFGRAGVSMDKISMIKDVYTFSSSAAPTEFVDALEKFYGPTMNAVEAAKAAGKAEDLHDKLVALAREQNKTADGSTSISATYMRVTVYL